MRLDGRVAFITGAARGQGRSHAVRLASEGADIIAVDICQQIDTVGYPMATDNDLAETVRLVEAAGRRIVAHKADVRDRASLQKAFDDGLATFGDVDIVIANAGIVVLEGFEEERFRDVVEVNLIGGFNTVEVAKAHLIGRGGGVIVLISSTAGLKGLGGTSAGTLGYSASKHGLVGLMRSYARVLAQHSIRVVTVHPTGVNTPMVINEEMDRFFAAADIAHDGAMLNLLPVERVESEDISAAVAFLVSDEARYVTGVTFPVDAGFLAR